MRRVSGISLGIILLLLALAGAACASDQHQHATVSAMTSSVERITVAQVHQRMQENLTVVFVDTRFDKAWEQANSKIPDAVRVRNNGDLAKFVTEVSKESFIVAYCT